MRSGWFGPMGWKVVYCAMQLLLWLYFIIPALLITLGAVLFWLVMFLVV